MRYIMLTIAELKKELRKMGLKTYINKKTKACFVKKSEVVAFLKKLETK